MNPEDFDGNFINEELETDSQAFQRKGEFDKPSLVMSAVQSCMTKRSADMRPGYTTHIQDRQTGKVFPKIIDDPRKIFCGSVDALTNLLMHEILTDEETKKSLNKFKEEKKKLFDEYAYKPVKYVLEEPLRIVNKQFIYKEIPIKNKVPYLPQKGESLPVPTTKEPNSYNESYKFVIENVTGYWDDMLDRYWDEMIKLYDEWFAILNVLISGVLKNYKAKTTI